MYLQITLVLNHLLAEMCRFDTGTHTVARARAHTHTMHTQLLMVQITHILNHLLAVVCHAMGIGVPTPFLCATWCM